MVSTLDMGGVTIIDVISSISHHLPAPLHKALNAATATGIRAPSSKLRWLFSVAYNSILRAIGAKR